VIDPLASLESLCAPSEASSAPSGCRRTQNNLRPRIVASLPCALTTLAALVCFACGGASAPGGTKVAEVTRRDTRIVHQECPVDGSGVEKINVAGDVRPDVIIVRQGGREICRSVDLNYDGIVDSWVYRDAGGNVIRRESDFDRDGRIDEISMYRAGVLVEKQRATTLAGRIDTWNFYEGGKLARTERDSDGDGQIDQWWEYPKPDRPDCSIIHSDIDGDGHPDPGASVDVCAESSGYTPAERGEKAPTGPSFDQTNPNSIPTEVEEKPATTPSEKK